MATHNFACSKIAGDFLYKKQKYELINNAIDVEKFKYNDYVTELLLKAIVSATSEFKRVYGVAAMYPDVSLSILTQAFSHALFSNKTQVDILDVYNAIRNSKKIYRDSIVKELNLFREQFKDLCKDENIVLPIVTINDVEALNNDF